MSVEGTEDVRVSYDTHRKIAERRGDFPRHLLPAPYRPRLTPAQDAVWRCAQLLRGFTDEELVQCYEKVQGLPGLMRLTASSIRTRRKELMGRGLVRRSPLTGTTRQGRRCDRWEVEA